MSEQVFSRMRRLLLELRRARAAVPAYWQHGPDERREYARALKEWRGTSWDTLPAAIATARRLYGRGEE